MTTNVGALDRILRAMLGIVLLYLAIFSGSSLTDVAVLKYGAAVIGVIMLATSALKICPLYSILGVRTCRDC